MQIKKVTFTPKNKKELLEAITQSFLRNHDTEIILDGKSILLYGNFSRHEKMTIREYKRAFRGMRGRVRKIPAKDLF